MPQRDQCIPEFDRRDRIPSVLVMESICLFAEEVRPAMARLVAATRTRSDTEKIA